jgi:hypothetical protein
MPAARSSTVTDRQTEALCWRSGTGRGIHRVEAPGASTLLFAPDFVY